jgi:radical SAM superfamily enzyme
MVVDRLGGDAPPEFLLGPDWCLDKAAFQDAFQKELLRRDSWQGKYYGTDNSLG